MPRGEAGATVTGALGSPAALITVNEEAVMARIGVGEERSAPIELQDEDRGTGRPVPRASHFMLCTHGPEVDEALLVFLARDATP